MATSAVIYVGGERGPQVAPALTPDVRIAADSGLELAAALGHDIDVVVGDMDSVDPALLRSAASSGARVLEADRDKDETDLELALAHALEGGADSITLLGGAAGRLDHLLANVASLTASPLVAADVRAFVGVARVDVVRDRVGLDGQPGMLCSLLAWGGSATGVETEGLRWELRDATLTAGSARGTSNEFTGDHAAISVDDGVIVVTCPDVTDLYPLMEE